MQNSVSIAIVGVWTKDGGDMVKGGSSGGDEKCWEY